MLNLEYMPSATRQKQPKSRLAPWQIEDAERLKSLFAQRPQKISQAKFGEMYGIGTQGMVWQYLNAHRPLNPKAAKAFADGLRLTLADISPKLATLIETIAATATAPGARPSELIEKCLDMNEAEWSQMLEYAEFLVSKRKRKQ
jgi:hypothetical protein